MNWQLVLVFPADSWLAIPYSCGFSPLCTQRQYCVFCIIFCVLIPNLMYGFLNSALVRSSGQHLFYFFSQNTNTWLQNPTSTLDTEALHIWSLVWDMPLPQLVNSHHAGQDCPHLVKNPLSNHPLSLGSCCSVEEETFVVTVLHGDQKSTPALLALHFSSHANPSISTFVAKLLLLPFGSFHSFFPSISKCPC